MTQEVEATTISAGYSIRVVSRLTGLSADTLRMWERRYGFPKPKRNDAGVRVYGDQDIERLTLISRAIKAGYRAGEVVEQPLEELRRLLTTTADAQREEPSATTTVNSILARLREDDADGIRNELRQAVAALGPRQFVIEVASELVQRVGQEWEAGRLNVRHEHLLSSTLSTQLRILISAYELQRGKPTVLLTALPLEIHSLGLEMAALYLCVLGAVPRLLGVDTPPDQIVEAALALRVDAVGLTVSRAANTRQVAEDAQWIAARLPPEVELWLGGESAREVDFSHPHAHKVISWAQLEARVNALRAREPVSI